MEAGSSPPLMRGTFITSGIGIVACEAPHAPDGGHATLVQALLDHEAVDHLALGQA
jgi:hypothetical protein